MAEKDKIFESEVKHNGIFSLSELYTFCYEWLKDDPGLLIVEDKYSEKLSGDSKNVDIEWTCMKNVSDYFREELKVKFKINNLVKIEVTEANGNKVKTNKGTVKISVKGVLVKDYKGKFEETAFKQWMRGVYEKWIVTARVEQVEDKVRGDCNSFLEQVKAFLDLEGKK